MNDLLYPYQRAAVNRLKNGNILCGNVGSGKSRTGLAYYFEFCGGIYKKEGFKRPEKLLDLFIITTAKKRDSEEWEKEIDSFLRAANAIDILGSMKVLIDSWQNIKKYVEVKNAFFIFDEHHAIGSGAWAKSFLKITKCNSWIVLTATPGDTWIEYAPIMIANGFYKNRTEFIREHVQYSRYTTFPKIERYTGKGRLLRERNEILVKMNYKHEAVPHHLDIWCDFDNDLYKLVIKRRWNVFKDEPLRDAGALCYCLRRIVNSDWTRLTAVQDILKDKKRAIVFYSFDYELEALRALFESINVPYAELNGHKHEKIPETKSWAYLVNYAAGAEAWECIATNTIIFYSQSYSYKTMIQAAGRIDRLNTPYDDLYYYHLKSHSSIDISINRALKEKRNFNEGSFAGSWINKE